MNTKVIRHVCCSMKILECLTTNMHICQERLMHSVASLRVSSFKQGTSINGLKVTGLLSIRCLSKIINPQLDVRINTKDMKNFLVEHDVKFEEGYTCLVADCNFCRFHKRGKNIGKLYINRTTGIFLCLNCQSCGSWEDLQDFMSLVKMGDKTKMSSLKCYPPWLPTKEEIEPVLVTLNGSKPIKDLDSLQLEDILGKFHIQSLNRAILEKYEARLSPDFTRLLFPIFAINGKIVGLHVINSVKNNEVEVVPRHLTGVLFGWKQLSAKCDTVIISSTPLDALAIAQGSNVSVVSLLHQKLLPLEVLPLLEPYNNIILWLGNDVFSWELAKIFAHKLNDRRCMVIRPQEDHPAPLQALKNNLNINDILKSAHPVAHKAITSFYSLRQDVLAELLHVEQVAGIKWKRYPLLVRYLKGHRRGELTVFTGPTGSGKTTFMSEYSLDLCIQGVRTLWGSFEIQNSRLAKMMLTQFSLTSLDKHLDTFDYWADQFEKLPLYFLTFHGTQNIRSVLDAMRHAVYVHDIEHVVVDNLQFMLGVSEAANAYDRFLRQDMVISSFRQFATVHKCHVTLVIHPRKENADELNIMSIFGGAKATQEADNVLILQDHRLSSLRGRKYVQVVKNRFDGDLGIVPLEFDKETLSFSVKKKAKKIAKTSKSLEINSAREETNKEIPKDT